MEKLILKLEAITNKKLTDKYDGFINDLYDEDILDNNDIQIIQNNKNRYKSDDFDLDR